MMTTYCCKHLLTAVTLLFFSITVGNSRTPKTDLCTHVYTTVRLCCSCVCVCVCEMGFLPGAVPCLISPNLAGSRVSVSAACLYGRHAGWRITGIDPLPLRLTEACLCVCVLKTVWWWNWRIVFIFCELEFKTRSGWSVWGWCVQAKRTVYSEFWSVCVCVWEWKRVRKEMRG